MISQKRADFANFRQHPFPTYESRCTVFRISGILMTVMLRLKYSINIPYNLISEEHVEKRKTCAGYPDEKRGQAGRLKSGILPRIPESDFLFFFPAFFLEIIKEIQFSWRSSDKFNIQRAVLTER